MPIDLLRSSALAVGAVLGGAGVSIVAIETIRNRPLQSSSLTRRWLTWVVLSFLWLVTLTSPVALFAVLAALGTAMAFEYARLAGLTRIDRWALVALPITALITMATTGSLVLVAIPALIGVTLLPLVEQDIHHGSERLGKLLTGVVFVLLPVVSLFVMGQKSGPVLVALLFGVALSDVVAFTIGSSLGRTPLAPRLSPNKTWEGVAGNLLGAVLGVGVAVLATNLPWISVVVLGPTIAVGALWGDLLESLLKRNAGVKDAGRLLPGFGGVLDRVDSLIVAAPLTLLVLESVGVGL